MNQSNSRYLFPVIGLGGLASICRFILYTTGIDSKGLPVPGHPAAIAMWCVSAAAAVVCLLAILRFKGDNLCPDENRRNIPAAIGAAAAAIGLLSVLLTEDSGGIAILRQLHRIFAIPAAASMLAVAIFRAAGKPVPFLCRAIGTVFFLLHALARYQTWSSDPQAVDYLFALGAVLCLSVFSYCGCALTVSLPGRRRQLFAGLLGIFCCMTAGVRGEYPIFHWTCALWVAAELLTVRPTSGKEV